MDKANTNTNTNTNTEKPNVIIYKRWHQPASMFALFSPILVLLLTMPVLSTTPDETLIYLTLGLIVVCIATPLILAYWVYPPVKDVVNVKPDGLAFRRHGVVPFNSITAYTLDGTIRLKRRDQSTLVLLGNSKTPGYQDFAKALKSSLKAWRAAHPTVSIKQSYFYGTLLAKLIGAFIVVSCLVLAFIVLKMRVGMGSLPALLIAIFIGGRLLLSERPD